MSPVNVAKRRSAYSLASPAIQRSQQARRRRGAQTLKAIRRSGQLYLLFAFPLLYLIIFKYWPMYGAQIAFRNFNPVDGITGSPWVGLAHFERFVTSHNFWPILQNTLVLNAYQLVAEFPLPIILALALNYIRQLWFRRSVQLVSYAPHFISVVVLVGIVLQFLAPGGLVNQVLGLVGIGPVHFMGDPAYWKSIYVWSGVWQHLGFSTIIYLAALSSVDPTLHEAAVVDGANKLQRIRDIDLPGIMPIAVILFILNMGQMLDTGFEKVLLLQNPLNLRTSEVIDTYVYRVGLATTVPNFSYAAAIGLFKAIIGLILIVATNQLAKRLKAQSLW